MTSMPWSGAASALPSQRAAHYGSREMREMNVALNKAQDDADKLQRELNETLSRQANADRGEAGCTGGAAPARAGEGDTEMKRLK